MNKLRIVLQFRYTSFIILLVVLVLSFIRCNMPVKSKYNITDNVIKGIVISKIINDDKVSLIVKGKEKIKCTYYFSDIDYINSINIGDKVYLEGKLNIPSDNTIPNTFNYKKYLKYNHINYVLSVNKLYIVNNNKNIIYKIKNIIINRIIKYKSSNYLMMFILGDKSLLDNDIYNKYKNLGVSHIFAISGLHISIISSLLLYIFKENKKRYLIVISFLLFYLVLVNFQASVLRSVILFIFLYLNKVFNMELDTIDVYYLAISFILIIDPYYMFNIGFMYSSIITYSLIRYSKYIKGNYIVKCIKISLISILVSLPITINNNFEVNILSFINNLFFVPFISFVIYPLSLISLIIPYVDYLLFYLLKVMELISNNLFIVNVIIPKMSILFIIFYYLFLYIFFNSNKKRYILMVLLILVINKYKYYFDNNLYVYYLDVGQGDSSLIRYKNNSHLIDTGGNVNSTYMSDNMIVFFKSIGVDKIDFEIISHGDYDHMGWSINLVNNFKVKNIIFNCGEYQTLEKELISVLEKKNINYYSCIKELNIDKYKLQFLNTGIYDNENDNSSVIYLKYNKYKFLFMGDAGITREKDILKKYNLNEIDFLKVGHHGSNTSSSEYFINSINTKYSLISVGKNNRYGHPKESVLDTLDNSKVYRTDLDGSIEIKLNKSRYKIKTCPP